MKGGCIWWSRFYKDSDKMWSRVHRWGLVPAAEEPSLLRWNGREQRSRQLFRSTSRVRRLRYFLLYDFQFPQQNRRCSWLRVKLEIEFEGRRECAKEPAHVLTFLDGSGEKWLGVRGLRWGRGSFIRNCAILHTRILSWVLWSYLIRYVSGRVDRRIDAGLEVFLAGSFKRQRSQDDSVRACK